MRTNPLVLFLVFSILTLAGCGGGETVGYSNGSSSSSSSSGGSSSGSGSSSSSSSSTSSSSSSGASFKVKNAVALIANEDLVESAGSSNMVVGKASKKRLFTYRIKKPGAASISARASTWGSDTGGTNLLAVDATGSATPAVESELPVKVMYTAVSPHGKYVYFALDNGWFNGGDGNDYSQFIAANNCALFQVSLVDNSSQCAAEGLYLQAINDNYMKAVSGNQKPIQFDSERNIYFAANAFDVSSNSFCNHFDGAACTSSTTNYSISHTTWTPRVYKRDVNTGTVTALTQDNEGVQFFLVLPSGEVAFQSWNTSTSKSQLSMLQGSQKIDLTGSSWGVDFFTVDSDDTVIFGQGDWTGSGNNGLRFASPHAGGGVEKASLDTSLFGADTSGRSGGWGNPKPRRIILGDDGRIYGVFEGGRNKYKSNGEADGWTQVLSVYQMLPYDGVPKIELAIANNDWWNWMSNTPFQISKGFLYYKETVDVEFFGTADVIRMLNLSTRETTTLLDPSQDGGSRYEIYNWRLSGNIIYFSALDKNTNTVVTGQLNTLKVRDGLTDQALTIKETASALGAASAIQDIEILQPQAPTADTGSKPSVIKVYQDADNPYSMSIDFSKYMNKASVEANMSLTSANATEGPSSDGIIPTMKVWLYQTLHLIPDLDGVGNSSKTTAMSAATKYTLSFDSGIRDIFDWDLAPTADSAVTIRPDHGWYVSNLVAQANANIASSNVLRYAGPTTKQTLETFDLGVMPKNTRVEFSAKNMGWEGLQLLFWDAGVDGNNSWNHVVWRYRLSSWTDMEYKIASAFGLQGQWKSGSTPDLFNGNFQRYRIDAYANKLVLSYSDNGTTFTELESLTQTDVKIRTGTQYHLLMRVREAMQLDNLLVSTLDEEGNLVGNSGDILNMNFNGNSSIPDVFATDVTTLYNLENW